MWGLRRWALCTWLALLSRPIACSSFIGVGPPACVEVRGVCVCVCVGGRGTGVWQQQIVMLLSGLPLGAHPHASVVASHTHLLVSMDFLQVVKQNM